MHIFNGGYDVDLSSFPPISTLFIIVGLALIFVALVQITGDINLVVKSPKFVSITGVILVVAGLLSAVTGIPDQTMHQKTAVESAPTPSVITSNTGTTANTGFNSSWGPVSQGNYWKGMYDGIKAGNTSGYEAGITAGSDAAETGASFNSSGGAGNVSPKSTSAYDIGYADGYNSAYNADYTAGYKQGFNKAKRNYKRAAP